MPKNWIRAIVVLTRWKLRTLDNKTLLILICILILLIQLFLVVFTTVAQEKLEDLQIGDKIPDVTIYSIINSPTPTIREVMAIPELWTSSTMIGTEII